MWLQMSYAKWRPLWEDSSGQMFLVGAGGWLYDKCKLSITSVIVIQQVFAIGNATFI